MIHELMREDRWIGKVCLRRRKKTICENQAQSNCVTSVPGEGDCQTGARRNTLNGFRRPIEEQEITGGEPRIIEIPILADKCPNYLRVKEGTSFRPG
jgi:hypothetical protein